MNIFGVVRRSSLALAIWATVVSVSAQVQPPQGIQPRVGQTGKDVIWVPTAETLVEKMLNLAGVTEEDYVIDLGSGDGRTVIAAAKRGAYAIGIEYNPDMVALSRYLARQEGVSERAAFRHADLFKTDFSRATVVTMFLLPELNLKLRPRILDLRPGTRIVSNTFTMGDWVPDGSVTASEGCTSWCTALLWIVPARVHGTWRMPQGELVLKQEYQMISGTLATDDGVRAIANGRLRGDQIAFGIGITRYAGSVVGNTIEGTVKSGSVTNTWTAMRVYGRGE